MLSEENAEDYDKNTSNDQVLEIDIGVVAYDPVMKMSVTNEQIMQLLRRHDETPKHVDYSTREIVRARKTKILTFQTSWLNEFGFLSYSTAHKGGYCKYCVLFGPSDTPQIQLNTLIRAPFIKFENAKGKNGVLTAHEKTKYHQVSLV